MFGISTALRGARHRGTVGVWWQKKGFGFIVPQGKMKGEADVFVMYSEIQQQGQFKSLLEGSPVEFNMT